MQALTKLANARSAFQSRADLSEDDKAMHLLTSKTQVHIGLAKP